MIALVTLSSCSAQSVTVEQLRQFVMQQQATHESDGNLANQLAKARLTERLTGLTREQMQSELKPGEKTAAEIDALADLSAFLKPPARELPNRETPTEAEQKDMLQAAANFATVTLERLPNFLATRTTRSFEDVPILTADRNAQSGIHAIGAVVHEVTYLRGREVSGGAAASKAAESQNGASPGLNSTGEFGPLLESVLSDSAHGKITWDRWEQTSSGIAAVFRFDVPREAASYGIDYCCSWSSEKKSFHSYHGTPAYRGSIAVDPLSGTVLRLTLETELDGFDIPPHFGLFVEYGAVTISGRSLVCPLRSSVIIWSKVFAKKRYWDNSFVNDTTFSGYRRFGSTAQVIAGPPFK